MKHVITKTLGTLVLTIMIVSLAMQASTAQSKTLNAPDKTLNFIKDVLQLDMTKYNTSLTYYASDKFMDERVKYRLDNYGAVGEVVCRFRNNMLALCMVNAPPNSSLIYMQSSDNVLDLAKGVIARYKTYTGDSNITEMVDILNTVDKVGNLTITAGNMKLQIKEAIHGTMFNWKHTFNGVDYNEIDFSFEDLGFVFAEYQSRYKMGSTNVNISKEQAIDIAIKYAENYSYTGISGIEGNETIVEISGFNITKERTTAQILPGERENLLYPCWKVDVALGNLYPGNVYGFGVEIWADTGKVFGCTPLAVGGYSPIEESHTINITTAPSPSLSPTQQPSLEPSNSQLEHANTPITPYLIAGVLALAVAITLVVVVVTKKRNK